MYFHDAVSISDARITRDGYFVADAITAQADNIQTYTAAEVGLKDGDPRRPIRVFRPADEVFAARSLATMAHRPIVLDHPAEDVSADNWKRLAIGDVGDEIIRDGNRVRVPIKVMDADGIRAMKTTHQEFSWGYKAEIEMRPGLHDGEPYDAVATGFEYNHLAACRRARGGSELRIVDERTPDGERPMPKRIIVDGFPVEVDDATEAVIVRLQGQIRDAQTAATQAGEALATLKTEVSAKDGEIAVLKKNVEDAAMTPERLDAAVLARQGLVDTAKIVLGDKFDPKGKPDADIRKAVVASRLGDAETAKMDDAAISGAFLAIAAAPKATVRDGVRDAVLLGDAKTDDLAQKAADARAAYRKRIADAHLGVTA